MKSTKFKLDFRSFCALNVIGLNFVRIPFASLSFSAIIARLRILLVAALLSLAGLTRAETLPAHPNFFQRTWRTENGLPDNAVTAVVQTHDGYLWVGTYGGLARFDGAQFTVFNSASEPELQSDRITALV